MALWLAKQQQWLLPRLPQHLLLPSSFLRLLIELRPFSTDTHVKNTPRQKAPTAAEPAHFMVDYLVNSCGLSGTDAAKASKHLAHLKSAERPDAVLRLLKEEGLCGSHIRRLVQSFPRLLVADVKKTLEPKIRALQEAGYSGPELAQLISVNPSTVLLRDAVHRIEFWRKLLGDNEKVRRIAMNAYLMSCSLDKKIKPNLSFLRTVGMSDADITRIVMRKPRLISSTLNKIMSTVEQVKGLGVAPGSGMFMKAVLAVSNLSQTTFEAKSKLLRSYGWSEDELLFAFQRFPTFLTLSEKRISRAMVFLLNEGGYQPSYVARHPHVLGYSIEKRLIPRCHVLRFLKKKGLPGGNKDLHSAMTLPDRVFMEKYIAVISENIPELLETYPEVNAMIDAMPH